MIDFDFDNLNFKMSLILTVLIFISRAVSISCSAELSMQKALQPQGLECVRHILDILWLMLGHGRSLSTSDFKRADVSNLLKNVH